MYRTSFHDELLLHAARQSSSFFLGSGVPRPRDTKTNVMSACSAGETLLSSSRNLLSPWLCSPCSCRFPNTTSLRNIEACSSLTLTRTRRSRGLGPYRRSGTNRAMSDDEAKIRSETILGSASRAPLLLRPLLKLACGYPAHWPVRLSSFPGKRYRAGFPQARSRWEVASQSNAAFPTIVISSVAASTTAQPRSATYNQSRQRSASGQPASRAHCSNESPSLHVAAALNAFSRSGFAP